MTRRIPNTGSIQELAACWSGHELSDCNDQLEEVTETVFERSGAVVHVPLSPEQVEALDALAKSRGVDTGALIQDGIGDHLLPNSE